jgi:hypothetical protein
LISLSLLARRPQRNTTKETTTIHETTRASTGHQATGTLHPREAGTPHLGIQGEGGTGTSRRIEHPFPLLPGTPGISGPTVTRAVVAGMLGGGGKTTGTKSGRWMRGIPLVIITVGTEVGIGIWIWIGTGVDPILHPPEIPTGATPITQLLLPTTETPLLGVIRTSPHLHPPLSHRKSPALYSAILT